MSDEPESSQYPSRLCPKCLGRDVPCDLCHGTDEATRRVGHFKAAAWLSGHPELHDTPAEFPAVHEEKK